MGCTRAATAVPLRGMLGWRHLGIIALGSVAACGLDAAGDELSGADTGLVGPTLDAGGMAGGHDARSDAKHPGDATTKKDGSPDAGDARGDASSDVSPHADVMAAKDGGTTHDGGSEDASHDSGSTADGGNEASTDAGRPDAGNDAGPPDGGRDAGTGVDASLPPSHCGGLFSNSYSCGSSTCGCNQLCDDGTTCGACLPHFGTCPLDGNSCDSDFSSATACGGCGNICCFGLGTCSLSGGAYSCEPCL
jgi:hypothetical protein